MSLELKYIMILSSSTLEKSDFLDVFVSKARWDCPTLVTLRTLMSTRLGTLAQNTVITSNMCLTRVGSFFESYSVLVFVLLNILLL